MKIGSTVTVSFRALRRNIMRSILTALGIIIGVAAVIATVSIGNGAKSIVEDQIASLGSNVILVLSGSTQTGGARTGFGNAGTLTVEDANAIANEVPNVSVVSPEVRTGAQILANGLNWATQIYGAGPDYLTLRQWPLTEGGSFSEQDVRSVAKVAVIGQTIVNQIFPGVDPIGQTMRIRAQPFRIVGVLQAKGLSVVGADQDDIVIIPYSSAMKRVAKQTMLRSINVQAASPEAIRQVQDDIIALLRQRHRTSPETDDFAVNNQEEIAEARTKTTNAMTMLLGSIAGVSLVVGGIGIMNIMLVSVTERTREIGIRLAVGAHGSEILTQFLTEAIVLSLLGGTLGVLLGIGVSELLSHFNGWTTEVSPLSVVVAVGISGTVGIFFGFYPARKAAQLDPIDALRYE